LSPHPLPPPSAIVQRGCCTPQEIAIRDELPMGCVTSVLKLLVRRRYRCKVAKQQLSRMSAACSCSAHAKLATHFQRELHSASAPLLHWCCLTHSALPAVWLFLPRPLRRIRWRCNIEDSIASLQYSRAGSCGWIRGERASGIDLDCGYRMGIAIELPVLDRIRLNRV